jgi:hypothetical protein
VIQNIVNTLIYLLFLLLVLGLMMNTARANEALKPVSIPVLNLTPARVPVDVAMFTPQTFSNGSDINQWINLSNSFITDKYVKGDRITLYVTGYGGILTYIEQVMRSIEIAKQRGLQVDMVLTGVAISGHAFLLCAADNLVIGNNTSITFHRAGFYANYMNDFIVDRYTSDDPSFKSSEDFMIQTCIRRGLLTFEMTQALYEGKRVVITKDGTGKLSAVVLDDFENNPVGDLVDFAYLAFCIAGGLILIAVAKRI